MPAKKNVIWRNTLEWDVTPVLTKSTATGARRRGITDGVEASFPKSFLAPNVTIEEVYDAAPKPARRGAAVPLLDLSVPLKADESYVLALRHPSGALTFHVGELEMPRRGVRAARATAIRFRVSLRVTPAEARRRGVVSKAARVIILRVAGAIADALLPTLVAAWEARSWKSKSLREGWVKVDAANLRSGELVPAAPTGAATPSGRTLLLLHGTFSHAASAFKGLAATNFFDRMQGIYGDQIFAFNHFTLSKTPEENAKELLEALPRQPITFDVITHSRGGLVLRNLEERASALGAPANRFKLHHAVLVASPNEGTPLATPDRWKETVGWIATLVDHFPDNPLSLAAAWVSEAIVWLAQRAAGGIPGLASMDGGGALIGELQNPPGPAADAYTALVANFYPDEQLLLKALDVGIDAFFGGANDLVVPTEGGWRVDWAANGTPLIPADRIGCYGAAGNLASRDGEVHHINFFDRKETTEFLVRALEGGGLGLPPVDPTKPLPNSRFRRGAGAVLEAASREPSLTTAPHTAIAAPPLPSSQAAASATAGTPTNMVDNPLAPAFSDSFQLTILEPQPRDPNGVLQLMASYGGARVLEPFPTRKNEAGKRFQAIIRMNERLKDYVNSVGNVQAPNDDELLAFGRLLFDTLFPPEVRRLYDVARSRERSGHLNVIFTSMISWIADKPWEFAFDTDRKTFLATEELHFVRNAVTAVPAERILPKLGPLRILVAVAQPVGTAKLSSEEEEAVVRRGFEPLIEAGLIEVEVLRSTTPATLHRWISTGHFDIVHFIGHGEFDNAEQKGYLIFEDERGRVQRVDTRTAREILCQRGVRLVFLNACETGRGGHADFNRGMAPALVAAGLPSVVANQYSVLDQSATEFAQHFYWALAQGMTLGAAAREARIAVNYSINGENIDWAVPVVYARDPESRLCQERAPSRETISTALIAKSVRRSTAAHKFRVAVWDINHIFPGLKTTLYAINEAQDRFGFEIVDVTAPIGTWQQVKDSSLQLHANNFARLLKYKTQELGVDYLFCITDHLIMYEDDDEVHWNYETWWSDPGKENIIIFSAAYPDMPTLGRAADHAIANSIVQGLTGILAGVGTHSRGPKTCPLYYNKERALDLVMGQQRFDPTCRNNLTKKIKDDLPALEKILATFD